MGIRRRWLLPAVAAVAGLGGAGLAWWRWSLGEVNDLASQSLWSQSFEQPGGGSLSLASLRGKPLLINFWATWCPPCIEELPLLDAFYRQHSSSGWQVLGIAVDRKAPVLEFLARAPLFFPVVLAGMGGVELTRSLGNGGGGLPFSVAMGADGDIKARKIGKLSADELVLWSRLR